MILNLLLDHEVYRFGVSALISQLSWFSVLLVVGSSLTAISSFNQKTNLDLVVPVAWMITPLLNSLTTVLKVVWAHFLTTTVVKNVLILILINVSKTCWFIYFFVLILVKWLNFSILNFLCILIISKHIFIINLIVTKICVLCHWNLIKKSIFKSLVSLFRKAVSLVSFQKLLLFKVMIVLIVHSIFIFEFTSNQVIQIKPLQHSRNKVCNFGYQ